MEDMEQQLAAQRTRFQGELLLMEEETRKLRSKTEELRRKIAAINTLLETVDTEDDTELEQEEADSEFFTPVEKYWVPILQVLVKMGGHGRRRKVVDAVGNVMAGILTPADRACLPKTGWIRWRNRVAWQISNMRGRGLIRKDAPRGIWEITDEGRRWLDDNKDV